MKARKLIQLLLSIPKTVFTNCSLFPLGTAIKLPVLVHYSTRIHKLKGQVLLSTSPKPFMIRFNWGGTESRDEGRTGFLSIGEDAKVTFHGRANFSRGMSLICEKGELSVGNGFFCNCNCCLSCNKKIHIGNNAMWGWNVELLDSDNHLIMRDGKPVQTDAPIIIGDHVWLAAYVHVLKGSKVPSGCVVGYRSLVNKPFSKSNLLIAGIPAKEVGERIEWNKTTYHQYIDNDGVK